MVRKSNQFAAGPVVDSLIVVEDDLGSQSDDLYC
jgi:hypothetical protein